MGTRETKEPGATTSAHRPPAHNGAGSHKGNREVAALTHKVASAVNTTAATDAANGHPATKAVAEEAHEGADLIKLAVQALKNDTDVLVRVFFANCLCDGEAGIEKLKATAGDYDARHAVRLTGKDAGVDLSAFGLAPTADEAERWRLLWAMHNKIKASCYGEINVASNRVGMVEDGLPHLLNAVKRLRDLTLGDTLRTNGGELNPSLHRAMAVYGIE